MIQATVTQPREIESEEQLDQAVGSLIQATIKAVEKHVPVSKPSPYAKRWFSPDLKRQQVDVSRTRRKWQESHAEKGRDHPTTLELFAEMKSKCRAWTRMIEKTKVAHWNDFLDTARAGTLWKAAAYLGPRDSYANIPPLKFGDKEAVDNPEKAQALLESFFPQGA